MSVPLFTVYEPINGESRVHEHPALKLTDAERAAGVTPVNFAFVPLDARRYGFAESASSSTNVLAIQRALSVAEHSTNGGLVTLPEGDFQCGGPTDAIDIPASCGVRGAGMRATRLHTTNDGNHGGLFRLGGAVLGSSKYGCSLSNVAIILEDTNGDGIAISLIETIGAIVSHIYIEGQIQNPRTCVGVRIDGGNFSAFENTLHTILCNHIHVGFDITSTGSEVATTQYYVNCQVVGDVSLAPDTSSVGWRVQSGHGNGSVWIAGNVEACAIGMDFASGCDSTSVHGCRYEANTKAIRLGASSKQQSFFGLKNVNTSSDVTDNSTVNWHAFHGCTDSSGVPSTDLFPGQMIKRASATGQAPLIIEGFPGDTTTETFILRDSSGNKLIAATNQGKFTRINNTGPVAVSAAATDLPTVIALTNQIRAALIADGILA